MAYEMVMPYHLHMPSYFLETFTEYPYINGRLFLYNKNQRNFPQDWEKLLTRFAASCNKISGIPVSCVFLCSFLWAYSSSGGKYAPPEELPQKSFRSFSLSANCLFMGFPAEGLALKILQPGIYSVSVSAILYSILKVKSLMIPF